MHGMEINEREGDEDEEIIFNYISKLTIFNSDAI